MSDVPPLLFLALRFTFVAFPAMLFLPRPNLPWRDILLVGVFMSLVQFALLNFALALGMPPGLASLLHQAQVLLTIVVAAILLRERPTRSQVVGILVGTAGLGIVVAGQGDGAPWFTIVLLAAASLSWAIGNVLTRRAGPAAGLSLVVWSAAVVPIPAVLLSLVVDGPAVVVDSLTHLSATAVLTTLYTVVVSSFVGYGLWSFLLSRYPASAVVPWALLVPFVGFVTAWIAQGEVPTIATIAGGAVLLVGLAIAVVRRRRPVA